MRERLQSDNKSLSLIEDLHVPKLGTKSQDMSDFMNGLFGPTNWSYYWLRGTEIIDFPEVCNDYERSYQTFFDLHAGLLSQVIQYGEVYDTSPNNIQAGLDYTHRDEHGAVHIQDVAIRNIVAKSNQNFTSGAPLLQIRTTSDAALGRQLSPFYVPFHDPDVILPYERTEHSWYPDSIEAFYQNNRRLAIAADAEPASVTALRMFIDTALSERAVE